MTIQNPYEDLIKIIEIILRKMELTDKKVVGLLTPNFSKGGGWGLPPEAVNSYHPIWLHIVNNVRTIFERQTEYIYIPDLRSFVHFKTKQERTNIY